MADVHAFELFHGIALTKIVRGKRPVTLRLIETDAALGWSAYTINDEVILYAKHSTTPTTTKRGGTATTWQFTFSSDDFRKLSRLPAQKQVFVALVCGDKKLPSGLMQVCLLEPGEWVELIDVKAHTAQTIRVKYLPGKQLRVSGTHSADEILVPRNRLDEWDVPGS